MEPGGAYIEARRSGEAILIPINSVRDAGVSCYSRPSAARSKVKTPS